MATDERYEGWTNYETWNVALWMDNDSSDYWHERADEAYSDAKADGTFSRKERATLDLADAIKEDYEDNAPTITGCYADLLSAALRVVNWYEIAEHYITEEK